MYGASDFCNGQYWQGWESATPACLAEIEWRFPEWAQFIADEVFNDDPAE
jgi:hypothetical protein